MDDLHCLYCAAPMKDVSPCRCCSNVYECTECPGATPCYGGECQACKDEEQANEALADGSLASTTW